jgi:HTH-type transcriptional regulator, sugar sensing transcriptional regulator
MFGGMRDNGIEFVSGLYDLGFSEREAKVYLALLRKRLASAGELQKISGIPQSKIYEVIDGLVRRGYCIEIKSGRRKTYEAVDPRLALETPFENLKRRLNSTLGLKNKLLQLYSDSGETTRPLDHIEVLRGNDNIHHRYCQLIMGTRNEILGFGRRPYACDTAEKSREQDDNEKQLQSQNVKARWIYEIDLPSDSWLIPDLIGLSAEGVNIRVSDRLPLKMMIFDRELLLVAEEEPYGRDGELTMSVIRQSTIIKSFCALFEYFWTNSIALDKWLFSQKNKQSQKSRTTRRARINT